MQVNTKDFAAELAFAARFIDKKNTIPILATVALIADKGKLGMVATDLEVGGVTSVEVSGGKKEKWTVCIPAKQALKYFQHVKDQTVDLKADGTNLQIKHGDGAQAAIKGMAGDSFPELPSPEVKIELRSLGFAIPRVASSISAEKSRFTLNGALLEITPEGGKLVSTDGRRLSLVELDCDTHTPVRTLICTKALNEVFRINGGTAWFGFDDDHQIFIAKHRAIIARKLTGNFPDYSRVIPKESLYKISVPTEPLAKIIERVSKFSDELNRTIRFTLSKGLLTVSASTWQGGSASGQLPVDWEGESWACGFNWNYVQDILKLSPETVEWGFGNPTHCSLFSSAGWKYTLMPLRI